MSFLKSVMNNSKKYENPFTHWELNKPLTDKQIQEIVNADIANPAEHSLNYDGTRAIDGGEGKFREGISDGGKALKFRCFVNKENTIQYAKEFFGENHTVIENIDKKAYLSALGLSEYIIVTCDSSSMISEAALTGKPIYVANILPNRNDRRFQKFRNLFRELNITRNLGEPFENWSYQKLDETNRVAKIIKERLY